MRALLLLPGLLTVAFSLATWLEPWFAGWAGNRRQGGNLLAVALGDSRRLFASQVFVKADAYFHGGYYPSIYDARPAAQQNLAAAASGHACELEFIHEPKDWLDRFSRHFYPSSHHHLGEEAGDHDHAPAPKAGEHHPRQELDAAPGTEREMLPWLKLAAELDPQQPQSYVVAAFWLRTRLGRSAEAAEFLREGLRANPGNPDILFELGRIYYEHHHEAARARNLWELALAKWRQHASTQAQPEPLLYRQLLANLAALEEAQRRHARALEYLRELKAIVADQAAIQKWIDALELKLAWATGELLPAEALPPPPPPPYRGPWR